MNLLGKVRGYVGRKPPVVAGRSMAAPASVVDSPIDDFDRMSAEETLVQLKSLKRGELVKLGDYERAHQSRPKVLRQVDALLGVQPWPGYDALDVDGVRFGLDGGTRERRAAVLAYEREHKNRAEIVLAAQQ
jgi:hypothetical protein